MTGFYNVEILHNFETAHRLADSNAPYKCRSIHGHSWHVTLRLSSRKLDNLGMMIEFGKLKKAWRAYLDDNLDHYLLLRHDDPVAKAIFSVLPDSRILLLDFSPTTENLARFLFNEASEMLDELGYSDRCVVQKVFLQETGVNAASFER